MASRNDSASSPGRDAFNEAELAQFASDGYAIVRDAADPALVARLNALARAELGAARPPLEYEADVAYPGAPATRAAPGGHTIRRLLGAYARAPEFRAWATGRAIATRLRQLLGRTVELAQAHHNCIMTKHPQWGTRTAWHQDIRYWAYERPELISVWLALGHEGPDNGGLLVLPGSHAMTFTRARFDGALFLREDDGDNAALLATAVPVVLEAGDALFFHCRLLHAAGANRGSAVKYSLVYTYHAAANRAVAGTRSAAAPEIALPL